jgi:hypothetical protein
MLVARAIANRNQTPQIWGAVPSGSEVPRSRTGHVETAGPGQPTVCPHPVPAGDVAGDVDRVPRRDVGTEDSHIRAIGPGSMSTSDGQIRLCSRSGSRPLGLVPVRVVDTGGNATLIVSAGPGGIVGSTTNRSERQAR